MRKVLGGVEEKVVAEVVEDFPMIRSVDEECRFPHGLKNGYERIVYAIRVYNRIVKSVYIPLLRHGIIGREMGIAGLIAILVDCVAAVSPEGEK